MKLRALLCRLLKCSHTRTIEISGPVLTTETAQWLIDQLTEAVNDPDVVIIKKKDDDKDDA